MNRRIFKKALAVTIALIVMNTVVSAQEKDDTTSLAYAFSKGTLHGHLRNVLMMTNNAPGLTDYGADAFGGRVAWQTGAFHHFRLAVGTHFVFPVFVSGLAKADPVTGAPNRYEATLFDVVHPAGRNSGVLLSELNLSYRFSNNTIVFGKQLLNTPFINTQDNRMQPTAVEGLYADIRQKKWRMEAAWLYKLAPRGTMKWYSIAGSMGRYPQGTNSNGTAGNYLDNVHSNGIGLLGIHWQPGEDLHLQIWEQYADNLFNTVLFQADYKVPTGNNGKWLTSLQYIRQEVVNNGGHTDPGKTYFSTGNQVNIIGARTGWENKRGRILLNYTRITGGGRFTMPREWGTEPLFTFLSRERNEGAGNVNAASVSGRFQFPRQQLAMEAGYGRYYMPDVKDYALNKYGIPSYDHIKLGMDYSFPVLHESMKIAALYIYKGRKGGYYGNPRYIINKVDVSSFSMVINYQF